MARTNPGTVIKTGTRARLIPSVADTSREERALSVFLAGISAIPEYAQILFADIGQRIGTRTRIRTYTEVTLRNSGNQSKNRPDGLIEIDTGRTTWRALVEAKIGNKEIQPGQIEDYIALAKENGVDSLITISNQFVALPTHLPVSISKKAMRGIELYHWSWMHLLTKATILESDEDIQSLDRRYLLSEITRYFQSDSSGISSFDQMNAEWKDLVLKIQSGTTPAKNDPSIENTVAAWHQEQRDICLELSRELGRQVKLKIKRAHRDSPEKRLKDDSESLVKTHQLECTLTVPDAASDIDLSADLKTRNVTCAMTLDAPRDKKSATARTNWVLRQLKDATDDNIMIRAHWPGRARDTVARLQDLREEPTALELGREKMAPHQFEVLLVKDLAGKFTGRRTFIEHIERVVPEFYAQVGQHLRAWVPPPPKPKKEQPSGDRREEAAVEDPSSDESYLDGGDVETNADTRPASITAAQNSSRPPEAAKCVPDD